MDGDANKKDLTGSRAILLCAQRTLGRHREQGRKVLFGWKRGPSYDHQFLEN